MSPIPGDMWATREFHIKWRRWSFIHTSWDNLVTLSQLAGYKRVTNYMKRANEAEVRVPGHHTRCCADCPQAMVQMFISACVVSVRRTSNCHVNQRHWP